LCFCFPPGLPPFLSSYKGARASTSEKLPSISRPALTLGLFPPSPLFSSIPPLGFPRSGRGLVIFFARPDICPILIFFSLLVSFLMVLPWGWRDIQVFAVLGTSPPPISLFFFGACFLFFVGPPQHRNMPTPPCERRANPALPALSPPPRRRVFTPDPDSSSLAPFVKKISHARLPPPGNCCSAGYSPPPVFLVVAPETFSFRHNPTFHIRPSGVFPCAGAFFQLGDRLLFTTPRGFPECLLSYLVQFPHRLNG